MTSRVMGCPAWVLELEGRELEAHGFDDKFHAAEFTWPTPEVGATRCVSRVTKSALTPACSP